MKSPAIYSMMIAAMLVTTAASAQEKTGKTSDALTESCSINMRKVYRNGGACTPEADDLVFDFSTDTQQGINYEIDISVSNGGNYTHDFTPILVTGTAYGSYHETDRTLVGNNGYTGLYKAFIIVKDASTGGTVCVGQSQLTW